MGFKSLIEGQVQNAMQILGTDADGLARKRTYIQVSAGTYDPATQSVTSLEAEHENIPMALVRFRIEDIDSEVRPQTDRVALIAALDLPVVPDENDKIEDFDGTQYTITRILSDPADAMHKIHIRRLQNTNPRAV